MSTSHRSRRDDRFDQSRVDSAAAVVVVVVVVVAVVAAETRGAAKTLFQICC